MKLQDRVAIVTGGARGIGEGIARCLAAEGATVAILDLDGAAATTTAAALGAGAVGFGCDVADDDARNITGQFIAVDGGITLR